MIQPNFSVGDFIHVKPIGREMRIESIQEDAAGKYYLCWVGFGLTGRYERVYLFEQEDYQLTYGDD